MAETEHQGGLHTVAGDADHGAVGGALPFYLHPIALPWQIPPVGALGHHAFQARHQRQPLLGFLDRGRLTDDLEERAPGTEQQLETTSAMVQWFIGVVSTSIPHEVKRKQDRG